MASSPLFRFCEGRPLRLIAWEMFVCDSVSSGTLNRFHSGGSCSEFRIPPRPKMQLEFHSVIVNENTKYEDRYRLLPRDLRRWACIIFESLSEAFESRGLGPFILHYQKSYPVAHPQPN